MQDYVYASTSSNMIDIEINKKKNEIQKLREEIKDLELDKSKHDTNFIGRIFELKGMEYIYVIGKTYDGEMYGMSFEDFEASVEIYRCCSFNPNDIVQEIDRNTFKNTLKDKLNFDKLKLLFD